MGTRGLLGFVINGKRIGTYNHFDSYLTGLGKAMMEFLMGLTEGKKATFKERLNSLIWVDGEESVPEELRVKYKALRPLANHRSYGPGSDLWPALLRPFQDAISLPLILEGKLNHLIDSTDLSYDGVFCEYVYWIDMEEEVLVVDHTRQPEETVVPFSDFRAGLMEDLEKTYSQDYCWPSRSCELPQDVSDES